MIKFNETIYGKISIVKWSGEFTKRKNYLIFDNQIFSGNF